MGARSGAAYLESLRHLGAEIWVDGKRVGDVTSHPALARCARSVARLYDMQLEDPDTMTWDPGSGERVGLSFIQPRGAEDVRRRTRMMKRWAEWSGGMLGRTPDYLSSALAAFAAARDFFAESDPRFGNNIVRYYEEARSRDWCATHTLVNPRASRAAGWAGASDENLALQLVRETADGIVVRGCRMLATLAPQSEELLVFPSTVLKVAPESRPYALAFAIPCATPGIRFLCRDPIDLGRSHFDQPLASRFEEMDAVVVFEDVHVPWERVFLCGDVERCNALHGETDSVVHMMHQVVVKNVAKSEFLLGIAARIAEASDGMSLPHVQQRLAEMIMTTEVMRACLRAAEADARPNRWGIFVPARPPLDTARNLFPRLYPRLVEILQLNGSSSLVATPAEADFSAAIANDVERYFGAAKAGPRERVALYRLAWDAACSAFAGRQVLYERFFFGDPVRMASALVANTDLRPYMDRVNTFLSRED